MKILNTTKNTIIATKAITAKGTLERMTGLLNRSSISSEEALVFTQCRSIHMFFMKFSIDVIFVDKKDCVVGLVKGIKPFRMSPYFWKASYAIELAEGVIDETKTAIGDNLLLSKD